VFRGKIGEGLQQREKGNGGQIDQTKRQGDKGINVRHGDGETGAGQRPVSQSFASARLSKAVSFLPLNFMTAL